MGKFKEFGKPNKPPKKLSTEDHVLWTAKLSDDNLGVMIVLINGSHPDYLTMNESDLNGFIEDLTRLRDYRREILMAHQEEIKAYYFLNSRRTFFGE